MCDDEIYIFSMFTGTYLSTSLLFYHSFIVKVLELYKKKGFTFCESLSGYAIHFIFMYTCICLSKTADSNSSC